MRVMSIVQSLRHPLELLQSLPRNQKKKIIQSENQKKVEKHVHVRTLMAVLIVRGLIYNNIFLHIGTVGLFLNPS